jgi:hypothetical protein
MSRSFTPPSTLSKEEIKTIADVRRDIWTNSFYGLGVGSCAGLVLHGAAQLGNNRKLWKLPLNRNTIMMSIFAGGALGSFIMATTTGKNEVDRLHPIFEVGAKPPKPSYQENLERAREREAELRILSRHRTQPKLIDSEDTYDDRILRQRNRLVRRASLTKSFERGGLSDSHGGQWVNNSSSNDSK